MDVARCPACGAGVRPGAPWCTLCYHDLRPAAAAPAPSASTAAPVAAPPPGGTPAVPSGLPTSRVPAVGPGPAGSWPCGVCGTALALDAPSCSICGTSFLAALRDDVPGGRHRSRGEVERTGLDRVAAVPRPVRLALGTAAGFLLALLVPALLALFG